MDKRRLSLRKIELSYLLWLYHITWLIFNGTIHRNASCFIRLQTTEGMRPHKTLVFLAFFSSIR